MYRVVHTEQTSAYRIEKKGFFGWTFVQSPDSADYLRFDDMASACRWIDAQDRGTRSDSRRWKVVTDCNA